MSEDVRIRQRHAANQTHSAWVSANAGSGKTRVLVERILRLMLTGTPPDKILALTFTKAAAAEMKDRLFKRLGEWSGMDDEALSRELQELTGDKNVGHLLPPARTLFATALETPGGLKVQTIHGFCQAVLERFPVEAGLPPNFEVIEDSVVDDLQNRALRDVIIAADSDAALADALKTVMDVEGESNFRKALTGLIYKRNGFREAVRSAGSLPMLIEQIATRLGTSTATSADQLIADFLHATPMAQLEKLKALYQSLDGKTMQKQLELLSLFLSAPAAQLEAHWSLLATQKGTFKAQKSLLAKKALDAEPQWMEFLNQEFDRHEALRGQLNALATLARTRALLVLADAMLSRYEATKQILGKFDFDDLITFTHRLLDGGQAVAWVMFKLDGGIDHILVDEAQDTSPAQWRIIESLAAEFFAGLGTDPDRNRTVFAVGDDKQSIYSFQGADPKGFARMREHFRAKAEEAGRAFAPVALPTSFRSTPPVLGFVDEVFSAEDLQASLTASGDAIEHIAHRQGHAGLIELWPPVEPPEQPEQTAWDAPLDILPTSAPQVTLANRIAGTIAGWLADGATLPAKGRAVQPGDIMILVRKRGSFMATMVKALKEQGVPVAGTDRMVLTDQMAVKDMLYAAEAALMPTDDLVLATCLKSPLIGFSEDDLFDLAANRPKDVRLFIELLRRRDDRAVFDHAATLLEDWIQRATANRPYEFLAHILASQNGRRKLVERFGAQANDPLDELLNAALNFEQANLPTLHGFLHYLRGQKGDIKRDLMRADNEVRVMTAHGSKGLEAPIVFLPDTFSPPTGQNVPDILDLNFDGAGLLPVWRGKKDDDCAALQAARAAYMADQVDEYRRLLYVGLTRAEDQLYLCGFKTQRTSEENCWYGLIEPAMENLGTEYAHHFSGEPEPVQIWRWESAQDQSVAHQATGALTTTSKTLPEWASIAAPQEPQPTRPLSPSRSLVEDMPANSPRGGDEGALAAMKRGTLVHKALELLPDLPHADREPACRRYFALPGFGLQESEIETLTTEVMGLLSDPAFAQVFGPDGQAEVSIAGAVPAISDETIISGQIDRLCVTDDEVLIVDYKTNRSVPTSPATVQPSYVAQLAIYRAALAPLYPTKKIRAGLLWTHAPSLMMMPEEMLDSAEADLRAKAQSGS